MSDRDTIIGRDRELAELEEVLASRRPALVLIVGGPTTGKGRLLGELRARSARRPCRLVPADSSGEGKAAWLTVDKQSTVEEFRRAAETPRDYQATADDSSQPAFDLILIYGYRPEKDFHEWFAATFVPGLVGSTPPRIVVIAGNAGDLADLEPLADRRIVLEPLPREAVVTELRRIDAAIADRLEDAELEAYADAVVGDPSLLGPLRDLLPLTPAAAPTGGTAGER